MVGTPSVDQLIAELNSYADTQPATTGTDIKAICTKLTRAVKNERTGDEANLPGPWTVNVTNFPKSVTENTMRQFMGYFGPVSHCHVHGKHPDRYAEVTFRKKAPAQRLVKGFKQPCPDYIQVDWKANVEHFAQEKRAREQQQAMQQRQPMQQHHPPAGNAQYPAYNLMAPPILAQQPEAEQQEPMSVRQQQLTTQQRLWELQQFRWGQHMQQWGQHMGQWGQHIAQWGRDQAQVLAYGPPYGSNGGFQQPPLPPQPPTWPSLVLNHFTNPENQANGQPMIKREPPDQAGPSHLVPSGLPPANPQKRRASPTEDDGDAKRQRTENPATSALPIKVESGFSTPTETARPSQYDVPQVNAEKRGASLAENDGSAMSPKRADPLANGPRMNIQSRLPNAINVARPPLCDLFPLNVQKPHPSPAEGAENAKGQKTADPAWKSTTGFSFGQWRETSEADSSAISLESGNDDSGIGGSEPTLEEGEIYERGLDNAVKEEQVKPEQVQAGER